MTNTQHQTDSQSPMGRKAGFQAIRQMSVLAQDLNQQSKKDHDWVKKFIFVGALVVVTIGLLALIEPTILGNTLRLVSGWVK